MALKLFDDGDPDSSVEDISKIEIDREFARRYEHNKKRDDLQRLQELEKKGLIEVSDLDSESSSDEEDNDDANIFNPSKKKDIEFFENLNKVKNRHRSLYENDVKLFKSDSDSDDDYDHNNEQNKIEENKKKNKKRKEAYLKDVVAQQLLEEGPEFKQNEEPGKKNKSYNEEQEELKQAFLDAARILEEDDEGDLLKVKEKEDGQEEIANDDDDGEFEKKLGEYFGPEEELDENKLFLKEFFMNKMWVNKGMKGKKSVMEDDEVDELLRDEEEIERQEEYEENYNFRYQENAGDRVMGHSRKLEGSVRKKENARKEQRKSKEERMRVAEMERNQELKHLKNLKKKEMKERMRKVMEAAGIKDDDDCPLDFDDLEDEFDPEEYDKMMKKAFDEKYYDTEDVDPHFASDGDEDGGEIEKPDFDKEDELLGLPKGWDVADTDDGFLAARDRVLKRKSEDVSDNEDKEEEEEDEGNGEGRSEDSKRKRKRKMSLVKKAKEEMMEEYYKLDYEGTVGDLKTRFKYAKVNPNRYGLKTKEILMLDEKELNQYVSIKKLAPYREKEWKVPNNKRHQYKMRIKDLLRGKSNDQKGSKKKKKSKDDVNKSTSVLLSDKDGKAELGESNVDADNLSRKAKRKRREAKLKLPPNRLIAYGKLQPRPKSKAKH